MTVVKNKRVENNVLLKFSKAEHLWTPNKQKDEHYLTLISIIWIQHFT